MGKELDEHGEVKELVVNCIKQIESLDVKKNEIENKIKKCKTGSCNNGSGCSSYQGDG
jgi:hypothetical protein